MPQYVLGWLSAAACLLTGAIRKREQSPYEVCGCRPTVNYLTRRDSRLLGWSLGEQVFIWVLPESDWTDQTRQAVDRTVRHEVCTHSNQSLYLGWLYLILIALPSVAVTSVSPELAKRCYFEKILTKV